MGLDLRPHNHLQHYDMLKDMWVSLAHMPTPRYAATSFLRGSKIYVLGKDIDVLSGPCPSLLPYNIITLSSMSAFSYSPFSFSQILNVIIFPTQ